MSDDLISRKAVIDLIESCHVFEDAYCLVDYINELPSAYDVDKVVERLEKMRDTTTRNISLNSQDSDVDAEISREIEHYQRIIQIVKSGGID